MILKLKSFAYFVLISMIVVTSWASYHESVFAGGSKLFDQPWGIATLVDTYFGFFMFYLWVLYKERTALAKGIWLILIVGLGNIAMAVYLLIQIKKRRSDTFEGVVLR